MAKIQQLLTKKAVPEKFDGERHNGENECQLFVPFRPVVCFTQHLTVGNPRAARQDRPAGHDGGLPKKKKL